MAPIKRWWEGGTCYTINPLIWRKDFSWQQADLHATELLALWQRLLVTEPRLVVDARLCRGSIAWRPVQDDQATGGMTYRFSRRPNADTYVGPYKVADFPGRWVFSLRPLSMELNQVADPWLTGALMPEWDWVLWRGAAWAYLSYVAAGLAAWALRNRYVLGVAAVVAGQQLAVLANISAQDFRYLATPILVGALLVPLLLGSLVRLSAEAGQRLGRRLRRRRPDRDPEPAPVDQEPEPIVASRAEPAPEPGQDGDERN